MCIARFPELLRCSPLCLSLCLFDAEAYSFLSWLLVLFVDLILFLFAQLSVNTDLSVRLLVFIAVLFAFVCCVLGAPDVRHLFVYFLLSLVVSQLSMTNLSVH